MKKKIYIKDWLRFKPYRKHSEVDSYYLEVCNNLLNNLKKEDLYESLNDIISDNNIKKLCVVLVCYFEDVVSGVGIWRVFRDLHLKKYGKPLPYYNCDNYETDETNVQDVCFIVWSFINNILDSLILNSDESTIISVSQNVMVTLDEEWEYAPENEILKEFFQLKNYKGEDEFYKVRYFIEKIALDSWLFTIEYNDEIMNSLKDYQDEDNEMLDRYMYTIKDEIILNHKTKFLNIPAKEWAAHYLGENHELFDPIMNISPKISGIFKLINENNKYYTVEHIASKLKFKLLKQSLDMLQKFRVDKLYFLGIAKWKEEWWFSGTLVELEYNQKTIKDEENNFSSQNSVRFLDTEKQKIVKEVLDNQLKAFKNLNDNSPIKILKSNELKAFMKEFNKEYLRELGKIPEEIDALLPEISAFDDFDKEQNVLTIFFNPNSGIETYSSIESAFPFDNNPYFDKSRAYIDLDEIFFSDYISTELAKFCYLNFKDLDEFEEYFDDNFFFEDFEFTLMFFKENNYESTPRITLTNRK